MRVVCEECNAQYQVADEKIGEHGAKITCKKCGHTIIVKPTSGEAGDDLSFTDATEADAGEAASEAAPAGEWYASLLNNQQVGPITIEELEAHWDTMELNDDSLCWKAGMGDWMPLAEIPELAFLVIRKPHPKASAESAPAAAAPAAAAQSGEWESGFSAPAGGDNVDWKPSGASDLASLVKEEVEASKRAEEEAKKAAEAAATPAAPAGLAGLFGEGGGEGEAAAAAGNSAADPFAAPANDPFAQKPQSAQAYNNYGGYPPPSSGGNKGLMIVIIVLLVAVLGGVGFVYWNSTQKPATPATPPQTVAQAPAQPAAQPAQPAPTQPAAAQPVPAPADTQAAAPVADKQHDTAKDKSSTKTTTKTTTKKDPKPATREKENKPAPAPVKENKPAPAPAAASCDKQRPEGADIQNVVKAKLPVALKSCLPAAKQRGEISSAFTLDIGFTVEKSGKLSSPQVRPADIASTGFAECLKNQMRTWRFPSFCEGSAVPVKSIKVPIK